MDETSESGVAIVFGAGTMGGGIAADLANAGWQVHLLDVTAERAAAGKERVLSARPPLLFLLEFAERIHPGSVANGLPHLSAADWVIEAVAEDMAVKREALAQIEAHAGSQAIVTSNTSGLSLAAMSAHCAPPFRRRFFGTHFLNPPRYLKLLEVIPTAETGPAVVAGFVRFAEQVLGHRVVIAKDTPGFISTRLWITHLLDTLHTAEEMGVDIETVDALTGPLLGRPRSATCRMADIVGLDIIAAVAANQYAALPHDPLRERLRLPQTVRSLLEAGHTGEKAGGGFYRRERDGEIRVFDAATGDYRPRCNTTIDTVETLSRLPLEERLRHLSSHKAAPWAEFLDTILSTLTRYINTVGPEIADDVLSIDRAMQWGFGWEMGPFAIADARGGNTPSNYGGMLPHRTCRVFGKDAPRRFPQEPAYIDLAALKAAGRTVEDTPEASLIDLGDGVLCAEFHTKMNTFRPAMHEFLRRALERTGREGRALVIGNQGPHFCAGYDLTRLVAAMARGDWGGIDTEMITGQQTFLALKYAPFPVVAAVHGFTLGAGCECALHCRAIVAAPETYMGLPELAVGVIPCHGGIREMLARELENTPEPLEAARAALRRLVFNRNTGNAHEARRDRFLRLGRDTVLRNPDRLLYEAKQRALALAETGYVPPSPAAIPVSGAGGLARLREGIERWRAEGRLSKHEALIADRLAIVLCGGERAAPGTLTEQALLDIERAVFLDLCREPLSIARMRHLLETGKPLRN